MKTAPRDCLHQEYLTINLASTSDCRKVKLPLVRLFWRWRGRCLSAGAAWDREYSRRSSVLPLNILETAATSQDDSSLEFTAAIAGRQCYIQDTSGRGLCCIIINIFFMNVRFLHIPLTYKSCTIVEYIVVLQIS